MHKYTYRLLKLDIPVEMSEAVQTWAGEKLNIHAGQGYRIHSITVLGESKGYSMPHISVLVTMESSQESYQGL